MFFITVSTCFRLVPILSQIHSKKFYIFTSLPHILWFSYPLLYLHIYPLAVDWEFLLYFFHTAFRMPFILPFFHTGFSLTLTFLIIICFHEGLLRFILFGILFANCTNISISVFRFGKFPAIISSNTFSIHFIFVLLLGVLLCIHWHALYYPICLIYCFHFFCICLSVCCSD